MPQQKYLEMFLEEGAEILSKLNQRVLRLEQAPGDAEALASALRLAHTLKGGAKMVGLDNVSLASHELETLLKGSAEARGTFTREDASRFLGTLDAIRSALNLVAAGREDEALRLDLAAAAEGAVPEPDSEAPAPPPEGTRRLGTDRVRVSVGRLDVLQNLVDDLAYRRARLFARAGELRRAARGLERVPWGDGDLPTRGRDVLRRLAPVLSARGLGDFLEDLHQLDATLAELQGQVLDLRMVPLAEGLDEFQRTVRDLAQELGKQVTLTVDGRFTEIDKSLLEALRGPLMHLVRNAVDHGLESPQERAAAGKPAAGQLTIRAYHKANTVVIEVEDDGRGLDPEAIRTKAVRGGYLGEEAARALDDGELYYLLCEPGFTTRERVTQVSGRGVGLDVVRSELEKLKGSLSIRSERGAGTQFRLFLPLSVSRLPALIVRVGSMCCALPSLFVEVCLKVPSAELRARSGTWAFRDRLLPVVSLARVLGERRSASRRLVPLVVLQFRGRSMALQVDELVEERDIVLKALGEHLRGVPFVMGATLLADEQPVPVLNVVDLYPHWQRLETTCRYQADGESRATRVLVVDDSMTARHIERTMLEGLGYEVVQASDGGDAWERLRTEDVDLVLTDVEMPSVDGLELARRIRGSAATAALPILMISNRAADEDQRAGLAAGADGYLRKDRLNQRELGAMLRQLLARRGARQTAIEGGVP